MAGLFAAIVVALGAAGYAAVNFIDIDPIQTGSIRLEPKESTGAPRSVGAPAGQTSNPVAAARPAQAEQPPAPVAQPEQRIAPKNGESVRVNAPIPQANDAMGGPLMQAPENASDVSKMTPEVEVADSEAEVAMLEEQTGMAAEPAPESEMEIARLESAAGGVAIAAVKDSGSEPASASAGIPQVALKPARVTRYVNLRDGPADEAKVIAVIPTNTRIEAEADCNWCVVTYNGQKGYVYKSFLRR